MAAKKGKQNNNDNSSGGKQKGGSQNSKKGEMVPEDRLQAVVLTDCFQDRFMPLTATTPRCLLPFGNVPLIEYTLEFLAKSGVNDVYIMCSAHAEQVSTYIENSKWNLPWSPFKIQTIMSPEARSVGDVMRDLDNRGIITDDFVLVSGDLITNVEFDKLLEFHKFKHTQDKDHIMTMCLSKAGQYYKKRSIEPATFILDKSNDRCIYYQDIPLQSAKSKTSVSIDPELLENVDEFVLRNDLIDCRIDICSPQVPPLFQDNFDYQTLRSDFVKGVISNDLLGKSVYAYITNEYAMRIDGWYSYDFVSQDYLGRWVFPSVIESNLLEDQTYTHESSHIYKEKDVVLAQSCKIGKCTAIGSKTTIGEGTTIRNCVIGRNCKVGNNISIENSYIWENAVIEDNCKINHCIVATNVKIGNNVTINDGSIIGFNVVIDDNMEIPKDSKISSTPINKNNLFDSVLSDDDNSASEEDEDENANGKLAINLVGAKGIGYIYESELSDNDVDEYGSDDGKIINSLSNKFEDIYLSDTSISSTTKKTKKKRSASISSVYTDREEIGTDSEDEEEDFEKEGFATVERAIENNHDLDTALLELNTLRMSMNVTYHEVRTATISALLSRVYHFIATQTLGPKDASLKVFNQWGLLFKRQCFEDADFIDLMNILMTKTLDQKFEKPDLILFTILNNLYDNDLLEEDVIYKWWDTVSKDSKYDEVKKLTSKWVEWLRNADEETSSEEDDDEEGD
ncbi:hypothetical protein TBLA_0H03320 [Henningerozyma blattae CBS 6284]|uniref:Translation initiation factor eIF2B subunit epsilon n=1 Tax=Henningerozyma blattae (strain ATCC 34711 / CBS 6284 / DSM 70876 / NBRC 10599 / NRRL Y-10934 / UCD 77-7) TaxID=1071380 RepID=I2H8B1_HENB6|nr:hypothetical protein TBLA_0H03320 [Tetrapisispora blattae CBS 6284]CCH62613.1 hypothetical protein TBLA_0H03320 [Tetrapisispora blattae CBS 6284]